MKWLQLKDNIFSTDKITAIVLQADVIRIDTGVPSERACYTVTASTSSPTDPIPTPLEVYESPDNSCECCQNTIKKYLGCDGVTTYYLDLAGTGLSMSPPEPCVIITNDATGVIECATYVDCTQGPALGGVTLSTPAGSGSPCCEEPECEQFRHSWPWAAVLEDNGPNWSLRVSVDPSCETSLCSSEGKRLEEFRHRQPPLRLEKTRG